MTKNFIIITRFCCSVNIVKNITNLLHKLTNMCQIFFFLEKNICVNNYNKKKKINFYFIFNGIEVVPITTIVMSIYNIFVLLL